MSHVSVARDTIEMLTKVVAGGSGPVWNTNIHWAKSLQAHRATVVALEMVSNKIDTIERVLVRQTAEVCGQCDRNTADLHRLQGNQRDTDNKMKHMDELANLALHRAETAHELGDGTAEVMDDRLLTVREIALEAQQAAASLGEEFEDLRQVVRDLVRDSATTTGKEPSIY